MPLVGAYSAQQGRWIARDPIGIFGGTNAYGYVMNEPSQETDPLGLGPEGAGTGSLYGAAIGGGLGIIAGGAGGTLVLPGVGTLAGAGELGTAGALGGAAVGAAAGSALQDYGNLMSGGFISGCKQLYHAIRAQINGRKKKNCYAIYQEEVARANANYELNLSVDPATAR